MVIELLGVPACGKSTYVKEYGLRNDTIRPLDLYLYSTSRLKQNVNKIELVTYAFSHRGRAFLKYNHLVKKIHFCSLVKKTKMWLYLFSVLGAKWKAEDKFPNSTIILDEGVNQVIWGFLYNEQNSTDAVWELQKELLTEMGDNIVYIKVSENILYERLNNRSSSGGSELEHEIKENRKLLGNSMHLVDEIVEHLHIYGIHVCIENSQ